MLHARCAPLFRGHVLTSSSGSSSDSDKSAEPSPPNSPALLDTLRSARFVWVRFRSGIWTRCDVGHSWAGCLSPQTGGVPFTAVCAFRSASWAPASSFLRQLGVGELRLLQLPNLPLLRRRFRNVVFILSLFYVFCSFIFAPSLLSGCVPGTLELFFYQVDANIDLGP